MRRDSPPHQTDPRRLPTYTVAEAAHYLGVPKATLRSWTAGRHYPVAGGRRFFKPVIEAADAKRSRLSFLNLVEAHVLSALRREHKIDLRKVRQAIDYLRDTFGSEHPLADHHFETDGLDLFVEKYGRLINITREGQLAMRAVLQSFLRRVKRDRQGTPVKLYLFTRKGEPSEPFAVVLDPRVSFGRPTLEGTNIPTAALAERYKAGDSLEDLAEDYGRPKEEVEEAIRYELKAA